MDCAYCLSVSDQPELLWTPSAQRAGSTTLAAYERWLHDSRGLTFGSYEDMWRWSVAEIDEFWRSIVEYFEVRFGAGGETVLDDGRMPGAQWVPGTTVSYPEHIFRGRDDDEVAISHASETRPELDSWTWGELRRQTARVAAGLQALGVGEGDRVCAYMPNIPETIACLLACASIGAIWSSAAPEFGARSVIDRFVQIEPKVLLTIDGYRYGGKDFDRSEIVERVAAEMTGLSKIVRLGYLEGSGGEDGFLAPADAELSFAQVPFDHPLWVLYSSGTTGLPKAIVQSHGGILLEQLKLWHLAQEVTAADRVLWTTTTGWVMWNILLG